MWLSPDPGSTPGISTRGIVMMDDVLVLILFVMLGACVAMGLSKCGETTTEYHDNTTTLPALKSNCAANQSIVCRNAMVQCDPKIPNCSENTPVLCTAENSTDKFDFFCDNGMLICRHTKQRDFIMR